MKVLGLVVEYNPFHNGHLYHLQQSKALSGAEYTVCVMSGNFIQRGEPALINKWARTRMALTSGVDLVIELPVVFAMASAEFFAYGAVKILDSLGIVDYICFGSESGSISELGSIADILYREPEEYKHILRELLNSGISFPAAREEALRRYLNENSKTTRNTDTLMSSSNNILGIEYLKALKKSGSNITPLTINRIGNSYNSESITGSISSATSIRKQISKGNNEFDIQSVTSTMPETSLSIITEEFRCGRGPVYLKNYENMLLNSIRKISKEELQVLPYVSEGLENRIKEAAENSGSLDELLGNICTKRYTRTRIQRTLLNVFTGITAPEITTFMQHGGPQYIRVLGFNNKGRQLLSKINKAATLPVIIKTADFKKSCNPLLRRMLEIEAQATDTYVLGYQNPEHKKAGQEFTQNIVRINL